MDTFGLFSSSKCIPSVHPLPLFKQALSQARIIFGNRGVITGISRTYTPIIDGDELLPTESTRVQATVAKTLKGVERSLVDLLDTVATKDYTNCIAKADVVIDGVILLKGVPATHLLFLEKQLAELRSFVQTMPTLDPAESWQHDASQDCFATSAVETMRTKKTPRFHVAYAATKEHPAQVHATTEDIAVGRWSTVKYSGAMEAAKVNAMVERIEKLQGAVKMAREEANRVEVTPQHVGTPLLRYIFG